MPTIMDYTFPNQAAIDQWYYSTDTTQLQKAVHSTWDGDSYADVQIVPGIPDRALWWDANHVHFGFVNLGFVSWFKNQDPWVGNTNIRAWPDVADLTNAEVIFDIRCYDLFLPGTVRIGLWYQARLPDFVQGGGAGPVEWVWCNYFQTTDLLDDVLGFGGRGMDVPRTLHGVRSSPWREWKVRLSPDDRMWRAMGSNLGKTGISYQPQRNFAYGAAPSIADMLKAPIKANMGIMFAWAPSSPDVSAPPAATPCPVFGRLQIKRVRLLVPESIS